MKNIPRNIRDVNRRAGVMISFLSKMTVAVAMATNEKNMMMKAWSSTPAAFLLPAILRFYEILALVSRSLAWCELDCRTQTQTTQGRSSSGARQNLADCAIARAPR
mmetsp:Transcript_36891/g.75178  ORF Transcript_36891/g.75178 Transcript_36891/m.75178 type:complete len:106 (+) Transcript_36891:1479-1796(+)